MLISIVIAAVYGLIFGSFANAVAYRVPTGETLWSRSHCPKCDAQITAGQNIPVISWLVLRGKCANCKNPISIQYPAIELLTSILFGLMAWKTVSLYGASDNWHTYSILTAALIGIVLCYFAFIGVVLSIIDIKTMRLPTVLIYPTFIFSVVLLSASAWFLGDLSKIAWMLIGGAGSFIVYFIIWFLFPKGFGFGDVRLILLTGSILGWFSLGHAVLGLILPFIILSIVALPLMITKILTRKTKVPLGPWIIAGAIISILFGDIIINTYLTIGGFL